VAQSRIGILGGDSNKSYIVHTVNCSSVSTISTKKMQNNCHLIRNNICKNIELLHVLDLTGPSLASILIAVYYCLVTILYDK